MIVYVGLEHDRLQNEPKRWEKSLARRLKHKYRLEELSWLDLPYSGSA
jgi:hypothetical protein